MSLGVFLVNRRDGAAISSHQSRSHDAKIQIRRPHDQVWRDNGVMSNNRKRAFYCTGCARGWRGGVCSRASGIIGTA